MTSALAGIGVDADDDAGPAAVPVGEGGRVRRDPAGGAVDRVEVHGRVHGRQQRAVLHVRGDAPSSEISSKKSARQYHCRPAGRAPSNALCSAVNGIGWTPTSSGRAEARSPARAPRRRGRAARCSTRRSRTPCGPTAPAGTAVPAGSSAARTSRRAPPGARGTSSRYQRMTSARVGEVVEDRTADDQAVLADGVAAEGERGDDAEVAAAAAQRPEQVRVRGRRWRCTNEPSARTTSADSRLSTVRPKRRVR